MSNGGWLCKSCKGPDGTPWRNWPDKAKCHKCRVGKGSCLLRVAGAGGGSPSTSARQRGNLAAAGSKGTAKAATAPVQVKGATSGGQKDTELAILKREVQTLKAQIAESQSKSAASDANADAEMPDKDDQNAVLKGLRADIACLEKVSSGGEVVLASKKAELERILLAKRAARPLTDRVKDVEAIVERRRKALENKKAAIKDLRDQVELLNKDLVAAVAEEVQLEAKLAEIEAEKVELYRSRTVEAANAARVEIAVPPLQLQHTIESLLRRLQPEHLQQAGCTTDRVKEAAALLEGVLALAAQLPAPQGQHPQQALAPAQGAPSPQFAPQAPAPVGQVLDAIAPQGLVVATASSAGAATTPAPPAAGGGDADPGLLAFLASLGMEEAHCAKVDQFIKQKDRSALGPYGMFP